MSPHLTPLSTTFYPFHPQLSREFFAWPTLQTLLTGWLRSVGQAEGWLSICGVEVGGTRSVLPRQDTGTPKLKFSQVDPVARSALAYERQRRYQMAAGSPIGVKFAGNSSEYIQDTLLSQVLGNGDVRDVFERLLPSQVSTVQSLVQVAHLFAPLPQPKVNNAINRKEGLHVAEGQLEGFPSGALRSGFFGRRFFGNDQRAGRKDRHMGALASVFRIELPPEAIHNLGQRTVQVGDNSVGLLLHSLYKHNTGRTLKMSTQPLPLRA